MSLTGMGNVNISFLFREGTTWTTQTNNRHMETERKQQTAVEWLEAEFLKLEETIGVHGVMYELIEKAKEMEKEQIVNAYKDGNHSEMRGGKVIFEKMEQYFTETYGK